MVYTSEVIATRGNIVRPVELAFVTLFVVAVSATTVRAVPTLFFDKADFLAATGATSATGPLPDLGLTGTDPVTVGRVRYQSESFDLFFGATDFSEIDWTPRLPGHDLAISDLERILVTFEAPVEAFGFDFVEPRFDPNINAPFVDSTFTVSLISANTVIDSFTFNAPDDTAFFVGALANQSFDQVRIDETVGGGENEFFGQFYSTDPNNPVEVEPAPESSEPHVVRSFEFDVDGVLPSSEPDVAFFKDEPVAESSIFSVFDGALHQRTLDVGGTFTYNFPEVALTSGSVTPTRSLMIEARLRLLGIRGIDGAHFQAFDGLNRYGVFFGEDGLVRFDPFEASVDIRTLLPDFDPSVFHTYRVESRPLTSDFDFFIDNAIVLTGIAGFETRFNGFSWGDGRSGGGAAADVDWDFVRISQPIPAAAIPEPSTMSLMVLGFLGLMGTVAVESARHQRSIGRRARAN